MASIRTAVTATQSGTGQGAIFQRQPGGQRTNNSCDNPAASGTALEIYATGMGMWTSAPVSDVFLKGRSFTSHPATLTIGGQAARVWYAGTMRASQSLWSVLQVNAVVPDGLSQGPQPVVLKIGANDNAEQKATVCVQ